MAMMRSKDCNKRRINRRGRTVVAAACSAVAGRPPALAVMAVFVLVMTNANIHPIMAFQNTPCSIGSSLYKIRMPGDLCSRPCVCRRKNKPAYTITGGPLFLAAADAGSSAIQTDDTANINYNWTRQNMAIALPALIGMLADPLLSLMDTIYVGRVGSIELAALGACTSIFHLAFNAFRATTAATTSLVAAELATTANSDSSESKLRVQTVTWRSLQLGFFMGMSVLITLLAFGNTVLKSMGVARTSPLYPAASSYLFTRAWAAPVVLMVTVAEGAFRGYGDTIVPLAASLTAAVGNAVLDPILMFCQPFRWGVMGAAAATAASQVGAAAVYVWKLIQRRMLPPSVLFWQKKKQQQEALTEKKKKKKKKKAQTQQSQYLSSLAVTSDASKTDSRSRKKPKYIRTFIGAETHYLEDGEISGVSSAKNARYNDYDSNKPKGVIRTILGANLSMVIKQGSLLLGWAFATARATRLGASHVAAHQVALSVWLVFALIMDGAAVSAQVLMSRAYALKDRHQVNSLTKYMLKFATLQGVLSMLILNGLDFAVPKLFTPDPAIQSLLHEVMPHLATQQVLVSMTLVVESMAAGMSQFKALAIGTGFSAALSVALISRQTNIDGIWSIGISALFAGRLASATLSCFLGRRKLFRETNKVREAAQ